MKKLLTVVLAVMMLVSLMTVTAFAADPLQDTTQYTIKINNAVAGHTYEAYKVFAGTLSEKGVLSDVVWGQGVDGSALLAALKASDAFLTGTGTDAVNIFAGCATAADVATIIGAWSYNETNVKNFAEVVAGALSTTKATSTVPDTFNGEYTITVTGAGYYFVKDAGTAGVEGYTDHLLQVVKNVTVTPKVSQPTFNKTVNFTSDGTYTKAIDAQIGDTVYYKLETTLPSLFNDYKQYHVHITDDIPDGFTLASGQGQIYILHANGSTTNIYDKVNINLDSATNKLTLDFGNIKAIPGLTLNLNDTIVVKYHATINKVAGVVYGRNGAEGLGNVNAATLKFSNDMNQADNADHSKIHTATLTSSASVYTYQIQVKKVDSITKAPLGGAKFYLYRNVAVTVTGENNTTSTTTKKMYAQTNADGVITGWAETKPTTPLVSSPVDDDPNTMDGVFYVKGLDGLAYHLEEVEAPDGYNKMAEDVLVTISSTIDGQKLTALSCTADGTTATGTLTDGLVAVSVNNTAGTTLPETGGMGTTIFYIAGAILILGAAVILISKKRSEA